MLYKQVYWHILPVSFVRFFPVCYILHVFHCTWCVLLSWLVINGYECLSVILLLHTKFRINRTIVRLTWITLLSLIIIFNMADWPAEFYETWHTRSSHRRNHVCHIFSRSVQGLQSSDTPKIAIFHWLAASPLQQCTHCRATVWPGISQQAKSYLHMHIVYPGEQLRNIKFYIDKQRLLYCSISFPHKLPIITVVMQPRP